MKLDTYLQKHANVKAENRLLKMFILAIGAALVINFYMSMNMAQKERIVILPPGIDGRVEISGKGASDSYVRAYIRYMSGLLLNYHPGIARAQFSEALESFSPDGFTEAKRMLYELADDVEKFKIASTFYPDTITVDRTNGVARVKGYEKKTREGHMLDEGVKTYVFEYTVQGYRFLVKRFYPEGGGK